jgi:23S rRNA (guanine1835-N2)-methyltransferase
MLFSPIPLSELTLKRYPLTQDQSLQAWNAADELLLEQVKLNFKQDLVSKPINCLIINDQFGCLTTSLNELAPLFWTDSFLSQEAIKRNLELNIVTGSSLGEANKTIKSTPFSLYLKDKSRAPFDLLLIRIPKHNSLLEYQLKQIKPLINNQTKIIAAGMTKEIHNSNIKLFESYLGRTTTSLAKKKARLIYSQFDQIENSTESGSDCKSYNLDKYGISIFGLPGVFSRDKLDIGTQVLLDHLPEVGPQESVIDLGCGNGILGAIIANKQPASVVLLADESEMAVTSAKLTFEHNELTNGQFIQTDILQGVSRNVFDYVVCNPPFHQQNVQTLSIAKNMFKQSAQCLKPSGELRVVANRHLKYFPMLKSYFSDVQAISNNHKFTVWLAKKPKK